jgi:hypothetical protein
VIHTPLLQAKHQPILPLRLSYHCCLLFLAHPLPSGALLYRSIAVHTDYPLWSQVDSEQTHRASALALTL